MERNFVLALALSFLVLALWSAYTGERQERQSGGPQLEVPQEPGGLARDPGVTRLPEGTPGGVLAPEAPPGGAPTPSPPFPAVAEQTVEVQGELWDAVFTSRGGALLRWTLSEYHDRKQAGDPAIELTTLDPAREVGLATPLDGIGYGDLSQAPYSVTRPDSNTIVFELRASDGVRVRKTYTLDPSSYLMRLRFEIENASERHIQPTFRIVWPARQRDGEDFREYGLAAVAEGDFEQAALAGGGGFFGGGALDEPVEFRAVDWVGAQTRYFLAALVPDVARDAAARFAPTREVGHALAELAFAPENVPPGQRVERELRIYLGPKLPEQLEAVGAHLDESVMKGWFPALTNLFISLLETTHSFIPNYGWAIIVLTILVRLLMAPIMQKQVKSMKRMGEMQPKIKEMQEKYADDKERQSQEMMRIYKESGFNPLTGCLPMFLQLPVFIGLYYALQGSIQLRQAPFIGWIDDLSQPESLFTLPGLELPVRLLPLLMGASMLLQQRITPTTMDPAQARMMNTVMPVMFTFLFYQFASGLVLYWFVSNVLGIAQQVLTSSRGDSKPAAVAATQAAPQKRA